MFLPLLFHTLYVACPLECSTSSYSSYSCVSVYFPAQAMSFSQMSTQAGRCLLACSKNLVSLQFPCFTAWKSKPHVTFQAKSSTFWSSSLKLLLLLLVPLMLCFCSDLTKLFSAVLQSSSSFHSSQEEDVRFLLLNFKIPSVAPDTLKTAFCT